MGSPILLGDYAPAPIVDADAAAPATAATVTTSSTPTIIPLGWSLAPMQNSTATDGVGVGDGEADQETEGQIVVQGTTGPPESDPMGAFNESSYRITQDIDNAFVEPVAYAYRDGLPGPIRDGLGNVVRNLSEPANFLNFLLQLKIGDAVETLGRFAINSTLGLGGLIDIAEKPGINLPYRRNGFANTLGYYGVEPGAYLYLPITGATTVRDLVGNSLDQLVLPAAIGAPFDTPEYAVPYFVISNLDARLEVDAELGVLDETIDPYAARRDTYLARRERDIALLKGEEPPEPPAILEELEEELEGAIEDENPDTLDESVSSSAIPPRPFATISITTVNPQSLTR